MLEQTKINLENGILNGAEQDLVKELDKQSKEKMEMEKDFFCGGILFSGLTRDKKNKFEIVRILVVEENK